MIHCEPVHGRVPANKEVDQCFDMILHFTIVRYNQAKSITKWENWWPRASHFAHLWTIKQRDWLSSQLKQMVFGETLLDAWKVKGESVPFVSIYLNPRRPLASQMSIWTHTTPFFSFSWSTIGRFITLGNTVSYSFFYTSCVTLSRTLMLFIIVSTFSLPCQSVYVCRCVYVGFVSQCQG